MLYIIVPCSPTCGTVVPAVEDTMIIREGDWRVPACSSRGAKLLSLEATHMLAAIDVYLQSR
jgi:hypothetical protein